MQNETQRKSLIIYRAATEGTSRKDRIWKLTGDYIIHESTEEGAFEHAFDIAAMDDSGVSAGQTHPGYVGFSVNGGDRQAFQTANRMRRGTKPIIGVYREWYLESGTYESRTAMVFWGYIANTTYRKDSISSIGLEVHVMRETIQNDTGTEDEALDSISGTAGPTIERMPEMPPQIGTVANNWELIV